MDSGHYTFRPLSKCRAGHKLVSVNKPISYSSIRDCFKRSFKDIVLDVSQFDSFLKGWWCFGCGQCRRAR